MKSLLITSLVLLLFQFLLAQNNQTEKTGKLTVVITGLENDDGEVLITVSNSREDYESDDPSFIWVNVKIENRKAEYTFEELPFGEYGIKLFHDENMDGELDSNFLGIPTEDYGFSNNARGTFGPADYDDAKFIFNQSELTMEISVD
ncbi:MAG: DUF2141 domain-containing protein [Bacteroidetes bacterium]|nr:DUF2141 domain-containing protein [Bacteroidota bacterium]